VNSISTGNIHIEIVIGTKTDIGTKSDIDVKSDKELKTTELKIFNPEGRIIFVKRWQEEEKNKSAKYELTLPTHEWEPGNYKYQVIVYDKQKSDEEKGEFLVAGIQKPIPPDPPPEAKLHLQQGRNHADKKEYDKAIEEFTLAIEIYPPYADAYSSRAAAYIQLRNYDKALEDLNEAYQKDPENAYINYNRAALYSLRKEIELSLNSLDKSLELGFNRYDIIEKDPDLMNLRKHPEYRNILSKYKVE